MKKYSKKINKPIANRRKDFIYKTIRYLFDKNQANTFCLENLNISGMMKNHRLAKAVQDVSWSMFNQILEGKCNLEGKNILIGITGGIAAYKICSLIRLFKKAKANVKVVVIFSIYNSPMY